jgi:hypothetical protein
MEHVGAQAFVDNVISAQSRVCTKQRPHRVTHDTLHKMISPHRVAHILRIFAQKTFFGSVRAVADTNSWTQ